MEQKNVYQQVTDEITRAVEKGAGSFEMPWHRISIGRPKNAFTSQPYSGVNVLTLWVAGEQKGYGSELWATYKQWELLGGQVQKGEKGTPIIFYRKYEPVKVEDEKVDDRPRYFARSSRVFNSDQVGGYSTPKKEVKSLVDIINQAEEVVGSTGADIRHGGDRAFYHHGEDFIRIPEKELFKGTKTSSATESYYAVLFHELTHWTGHEARLDRDMTGRFGDESYAMEELVAELGAAFLCADLEVANSPREDHAAYIANWLQVMQNDPKAIFTASRKASEGAGYVMKGNGG